jgi:hypothetical protein
MRWRSAGPADRQLGALWFVAAAAVVATVPLVGLGSLRMPPCPFHALTGIACPMCGATRALGSLAVGDVLGALAWNPLFVAGIGLFVIGGLLAPAWQRCVGLVPDLRGAFAVRVALVAMVAANWIYLWMSGV